MWQVSELSETHSKELEDIEAANNKKLMSEYEKYQELQTKSQRLQEDYERQLQQMEEAREHALEELTEYYEKKLQGLFIIVKWTPLLCVGDDGDLTFEQNNLPLRVYIFLFLDIYSNAL